MLPGTLETEAEYEAAMARIDELLTCEPGTPEAEELDRWSILAEAYEEEHYPIEPPEPIQLICFVAEQRGLMDRVALPQLGRRPGQPAVLNARPDLAPSAMHKLRNDSVAASAVGFAVAAGAG